jgi:hypothetical protein
MKLIYHDDSSIDGGFSPFDEAIRQVSNSQELLIACPYIDVNYIQPLLEKQVKWRILSDIEAWLSAFQGKAREEITNFILENKSKIHHYRNLHAKVIIGEHLCIIGSANLTIMGITQRAEMSILLEENNYIQETREWFEKSWLDSNEIDIAEFKEYVQRTNKIINNSESESYRLNLETPMIKSKIAIESKKAEQKISKSNVTKGNNLWNGRDFYVNIGEGRHRNWNDCQKYGFVSGGSDKKYSQALNLLFTESRIFVYIPGTGYVGVGIVKDTAVPVKDFKVLVNGQKVPILDLPIFAPNMGEYANEPDKSEYLVRVEWIKAVPKNQAYREKGLFTNPHTACRMKNNFTIEKLSQHFGLDN